MNMWMIIGLYIIAILVSNIVSGAISTLFHLKWSLGSIKMMSDMYVKIVSDIIIGGSLCGYIMIVTQSPTTWQGCLLQFAWGFSMYALACIVIDVRKYNKLQKSLELLDITTDEQLEQFIKEQE